MGGEEIDWDWLPFLDLSRWICGLSFLDADLGEEDVDYHYVTICLPRPRPTMRPKHRHSTASLNCSAANR